MENDAIVPVQVCYITAQRQFLKSLYMPVGSTIRQTIQASGLLEQFGELDLSAVKVGIYSKIKTLETVVRPRDRVEVYRPLLVDPMVARRARAKRKNGS